MICEIRIEGFIHFDLVEKLLVLVLESLNHINMVFFDFLNFCV